tara:strand:- start:1238 stop:1798 length:561 start_codon:yes stop_codon:yes gene_type:complete
MPNKLNLTNPSGIGKKKVKLKKKDIHLLKRQLEQRIEERKRDEILKYFLDEGKDDTKDSVGILIFCKNRMLSTQRQSGEWSIPKGRMKINEKPVEAIQREVTEELGFQLPKIPRKISILQKENGGTFHLYAVVLDRVETIFLNDEHKNYHWEVYETNVGVTLAPNFDPRLRPEVERLIGIKDVNKL